MPKDQAISVYLDSNVMFSVSYEVNSDLLLFWKLRDVTPVTSQYVVGEVSRNIKSLGHRERFEGLLAPTQFVSDAELAHVPSSINLALQDQPILAAAMFSSVDYLVTGDINHFAHLYDTTVGHMTILRPSEFLRLYKDRTIK